MKIQALVCCLRNRKRQKGGRGEEWGGEGDKDNKAKMFQAILMTTFSSSGLLKNKGVQGVTIVYTVSADVYAKVFTSAKI
jgi:hypothetical protein